MKSPQILHIADDEKFIKGANYLFEKAFPGSNTFVIIMPPRNNKPKYVRPEKNIRFEPKSPELIDRLRELCDRYDIIVIHKPDPLKGTVVLQSETPEKFMGILYGGEVFNSNLMDNDFLGEKTRKLYDTIKKGNAIESLKNVYRSVRYREMNEIYKKVCIKDVLNKIPVYGSLTENTYEDYVRMGVMNEKKKVIPFTYYPLEYIIRDKNLSVRGDDIWLGNSASATNNHLEAFDILKEANTGRRKIYVPLSYGSKTYAREIERTGRKMFGDRFVPVTDFLPVDEYHRLMSRCSTVIMNHYRPQALGNIIAALYMGARVYMNNTDLYRYFSGLGCRIYLLEQEKFNIHKIFNRLSEEEAILNCGILEKEISEKILINELKKSLK